MKKDGLEEKRKNGKDFLVEASVVGYSDEQMLVDMVRENLTQRDSDFRDIEDSVVLARAWLQSKASNVKQFYKTLSKRGRVGEGRPKENGSVRDIAKFLSKQGKTISHEKVRSLLNIGENLAEEIEQEV